MGIEIVLDEATKRKQVERYGFEKDTSGEGKQKKSKQTQAVKKRKRVSTDREMGEKKLKAGAQKWIIRIGPRMIERIEGRYEAQDAPT